MIRPVQGGANEVRHGRIHDDKRLVAGSFSVKYAGEKHACVGGDAAAWFEQNLKIAALEQRHDCFGISDSGRGLIVCIMRAKATAHVERRDFVAGKVKVVNQFERFLYGFDIWIDGVDRRAEVEVDATEAHTGRLLELIKNSAGAFQIDSEFGLALARGGVDVRMRIDVGVDAQCDASEPARSFRDALYVGGSSSDSTLNAVFASGGCSSSPLPTPANTAQ
jgi:hypothetical protein